jgi:signal peptidase I
MRGFARELIWMLAITIVIFLGLRLVVGSYAVVSQSMEPGMQVGERLLVNKLAYKFHDPERGDIVYFKSPETNLNQMKRIIGLPGDIIQVSSGVVYLNGHQISEPYVHEIARYNVLEFQIPAANYFVLGDNRNNSNDSSTGWTVPADNILGKAWILTWPPNEWGAVGNYNLSLQLAAAEINDSPQP